MMWRQLNFSCYFMRYSLKIFLCFCITLLCTAPVFCQDNSTQTAVSANDKGGDGVHRLAEYDVDEHAKSVLRMRIEVLVKNRAAVDRWSQVRLEFNQRMESLDIVEAYTLTPDGTRVDVPKNRIYVQESYSSKNAPLYADDKVKVIVFPDLQPGGRIVYRYRREQRIPYFPGYFNFWEVFDASVQYDDAVVRLTAPANLPMHVLAPGVKGGRLPDKGDGRVRWEWQHRQAAMPQPAVWPAMWEFSPNIMASTYSGYSDIGRAYHGAAAKAANVTPAVKALANSITQGIQDREGQARAIHQWVVEHIRYVAVYLGNGGLEPNSAADILRNRYGDCKDYTVVLAALLAAKGIDSTPALLGVDLGTTLPAIAVLGRLNHAILYLPEFDLYLDGTVRYAKFGQFALLSMPVVHTVDGKVSRTPDHSVKNSFSRMEMHLRFARNGDLVGRVDRVGQAAGDEIFSRTQFAELAGPEDRQRAAQHTLAAVGYLGTARFHLDGVPDDLNTPFRVTLHFEAPDYVDFDMVGGMTLPALPSHSSMRGLSSNTSALSNATPFECTQRLWEETYVMAFPEGVPIVSIPRDYAFSNPAGSYSAQWRREGSVVIAVHRLQQEAVRGAGALCQPSDYPLFRHLFDHVRKGFRAQVTYGQMAP
jgi:transglutaminase-like putative cysteine protease